MITIFTAYFTERSVEPRKYHRVVNTTELLFTANVVLTGVGLDHVRRKIPALPTLTRRNCKGKTLKGS